MNTLELKDVRCAWSREWWKDGDQFEGVTLALEPGEWCGIVGDNGLGKSTLLHGIAGSCPFVLGEIRVGANTLSPLDLRQRFELGVVLVPQEPKCDAWWTMSDIETMAFTGRRGMLLEQAVKSVQIKLQSRGILDSKCKRLFSPKEARTLVAILSIPSVLLLDEAGDHLSYVAEGDSPGTPVPPRKMYELVKNLLPDTSVVFVEHDHSVAFDRADKVVLATMESVDAINKYKFSVVRKEEFSLHSREIQGRENADETHCPLLDLEKSPREHMQVAMRASCGKLCRNARSVLDVATRDWNFLMSIEPSDLLSGGQKVILQCVMEILWKGRVDPEQNRMKHVFPLNVTRLKELMKMCQESNA